MKLHLPLSLRSALVLAVATFAAAPSHAAVTQWDLDKWTGYDAAAGSVTVGPSNDIYQAGTNQSWNSNWAYVMSVNAADLTGNLTLIGVDRQSGSNHYYSEGVTLTKETDGSLKLHLTTYSADIPSSTSVSFAGSQNITFLLARDNSGGAGNLSVTAYDSNNLVHGLYTIHSSVEQSFKNNIVGGASFGGLVNYSKDGSTSFPDNPGSYSITKAGYSMGSLVSASDLVNYYYGTNHKTLTWAGGASGNWSGASWNDGATGSQTFGIYDSATFATENASVTLAGTTPVNALAVNANTTIDLEGNNLNAVSLTVAAQKTLSLAGTGTVDVASLSGGTVNVADGVTLTLAGTTLGNTTVTGALTLASNARVTLTGAVTLESVVNNMTGSDAYAFVGNGAGISLKFTGITDLTRDGNGNATTHSKIGLNQGKLIVAEDASLTTARIWNSDTLSSNANVEVKERGTLVMSGSEVNILASLTNSGSVTVATGSTSRNILVNGKVDNKAGATLTAGTLQLKNAGNVTSELGGTVNVTKLQLDGGKATVSGAVTANQIVGASAAAVAVLDVANGGTLTLTGETLTNATVNGALTLTHNGRVKLTGNVTLGSIVNNLAGSDKYAFVGAANVNNINLTFTGATDLTKKGNGTDTVRSLIGLNASSAIVVDNNASLKSGALYNSAADSASIHVKEGGSVELTGFNNGSTNMSAYAKDLTNEGTFNAATLVHVNQRLDNTGTLTAKTLEIVNGDSTVSNLGGTVTVGTLKLAGGEAEVSGKVTADIVEGENSTTLKGSDAGTGTLTIMGASAHKASLSGLAGNFSVVKKDGAYAQSFAGDNSGFTGSLTVESGTINLAKIGTEVMNLKAIRLANSATLGLYEKSLSGADSAYKANVSTSRLETGAGGGTLNANIVMGAGSALALDSAVTLGGALTLDGTLLSGALLDSLNRGAVDSITLFTGVSSLTIGSEAATLAAEGETFSAVTFGGNRDFTAAELSAAFGNAFDPNVYTASYTADNGGSIIMTANVPEPATATLSLLALAGLCARRRRK